MSKVILENFKEIQLAIPDHVKLVAVSKTKPIEAIQVLHDAGQRIFGENRVQELVEKHELLPEDIKWHLIGHLQRNKVKYIAPFVDMIHSIDSERLLDEVNSQAEKNNRKIKVLLQFFIATEETKFGFDWNEINELFSIRNPEIFESIEFCGVMGMASFSNNQNQVRNEFKKLKQIFDQLKQTYFSSSSSFLEISMGMSGDYQMAIDEGSTMIRVGSSLFGSR
ncbi:MAG: YggS family pyridoxal phosphate-dependent enzyme [Bacteroidetes bacterium]|nr:YggS family pyridoxal phosphate-dependent enzyme [Bacteroidota bacterium]